jgi:hypothetical protein
MTPKEVWKHVCKTCGSDDLTYTFDCVYDVETQEFVIILDEQIEETDPHCFICQKYVEDKIIILKDGKYEDL